LELLAEPARVPLRLGSRPGLLPREEVPELLRGAVLGPERALMEWERWRVEREQPPPQPEQAHWRRR
jgi:hypothetical protein